MKTFLITVTISITLDGLGQTYKQSDFDETIHGLTTIVSISTTLDSQKVSSQGTGFFYHKYNEQASKYLDENINSINPNLESIWLITNKHVLFPRDSLKKFNRAYPAKIEFYLRKKITGSPYPKWDTIRLKQSDIQKLIRLHTDTSIDVAAINISAYVRPKLEKGDSAYHYAAVSKVNFPSPDIPMELNGFGVRVGYEILTIGYPYGFYDDVNLFPSIKSGVIASKWKAKYKGHHFFLIDSKLFPGASGSIVVTGISSINNLQYFQFLGIYSGGYRIGQNNDPFNIGTVWYYYLIEEIIN